MADTIIEALIGDLTYDLTDKVDFVVEGEDAWGMAPLQRLTERGPNQHGVTDRGFRLDPRIFHLAVPALAEESTDHYALRELLIEIFAPADDPIRLRRTDPAGRVRQIDCHYVDGLGFASRDRVGHTQRNIIQLMAPDPTLYDPAGETVSFALAGSLTGGGVIPLVVPMAVGASDINSSTVITYPGTWNSSPIILVTGPATNLVITQEVSGDKLDFTGSALAAGHTWTIDTRYGQGLAYLDGDPADSVLDLLSDDSDLGSFAILRAREVAGGLNPIRVVASAVNDDTHIDLTYFVRYLGI